MCHIVRPIAAGTFFPQLPLAAPLNITEPVAATPFGAGVASRSPSEDLVTDNRFVGGFILSVEGPNNRRIGWASVYWISVRSFNLHWHLARSFSLMSPRLLEPLRQTTPSDSDSLNYGMLMRGKATPIPRHPHESC